MTRGAVIATRGVVIAGWVIAVALAVGVRLWNALLGPLMWGYDAWGHVAYVLFLDLYRAVPWADQGWSYFHPPFHYAFGWLLAQFGSGEILMRGLSLLGSAASLGIAAATAILVRRAAPERPALPLVAFAAVALLPAHLFMSPMPGNELTQAFAVAAAIVVWVANERRSRSAWSADVVVGVLLGFALLTKFNGLLGLGVVVGSILAVGWLAGPGPGGWRRRCARLGIVTALALAIPSPYYVRNVEAFGTPFQLSRDFALVTSVERGQPPGQRRLSDYVYIPASVFSDPNPLSPDLLHSIWGTVYLDAWADVFRESDVERALVAEREQLRSSTFMALVGLLPTALALAGAGLALSDVLRRRRVAVYVPMLLASGASLLAFAVFTWQVPIWSALKSSYLVGLSLPYGVFLARALEALLDHAGRAASIGVGALLTAGWTAAGVVGMEGVVVERRADAPATGAVHFYFSEYDAARDVYGRLVAGSVHKAPWLDNLAAVALAEGEPERARQLYARAVATGRPDPHRVVRLSVATALAGDPGAALALLDGSAEALATAEGLANRGALLAARGDPAGAERDLRTALDRNGEMTPAWLNLARTLAATGRAADARAARESAMAAACSGPRGYPYGVGTGEVLEWGIGRRWLLLWDGRELRAATAQFHREACGRLSEESAS